MNSLVESQAFDRLRQLHGDRLDAFLAEAVDVVEGDLTKESLGLSPETLAGLVGSLDVVLHVAAYVKWGSRLDDSVKANSVGAARIAELVRLSRDAGRDVRLVHVSTGWVHGLRSGGQACLEAPSAPNREGPPGAGPFDPGLEVEVCLKQVDQVEAESRLPAARERFLRRALQRLGPASPGHELEAQAEDLRARWVTRQMTDWGMARARSWGWNDCYTFSKAVGEHLVARLLHDVPFAIVRPTGIVSASEQPHPGWTDAYLLVEPLIEQVGTGAITSFPGSPSCVVDVVPVDFVITTMLAAAAALPSQPDGHGPRIYQCASGDVCPTTLGEIEASWMRSFREAPMLDRDGRAVTGLRPVEYTPDTAAFAAGLRRRYMTPLRVATGALESVPRWESVQVLRRMRMWMGKKRRTLEKVVELATLYSAYTMNSWDFRTENTRALVSRIAAEERPRYPYFPEKAGAWDWDGYWRRMHIPGMKRWVLRYPAAPLPSKL